MMKPAHIGVILLMATFIAASQPEESSEFTTIKARAALVEFRAQWKQSREKYDYQIDRTAKALEELLTGQQEARSELIAKLKVAQEAAVQNKNVAEVTRIQNGIAAIQRGDTPAALTGDTRLTDTRWDVIYVNRHTIRRHLRPDGTVLNSTGKMTGKWQESPTGFYIEWAGGGRDVFTQVSKDKYLMEYYAQGQDVRATTGAVAYRHVQKP